jgi:N-acetylmuramoyl-L-alanine amidase
VVEVIAAPAHPANYSERPAGARPSAVVYHDTGGSAASAIEWFQNPHAQVSAHYIVAADGKVYSCVPETKKAWHAGSSILWNVPDLNAWSIGIELEDTDDGAPYPKAQLEALLEVAVDVTVRYRIPLHAHVGHQHICVPRGRKVDPSGDFDWFTFLNALGHRVYTRGPLA